MSHSPLAPATQHGVSSVPIEFIPATSDSVEGRPQVITRAIGAMRAMLHRFDDRVLEREPAVSPDETPAPNTCALPGQRRSTVKVPVRDRPACGRVDRTAHRATPQP